MADPIVAKLVFDAEGERKYSIGTKHGVLYKYAPNDSTTYAGSDPNHPATEWASGYGKGVVWNGLTGVSESPSGADETTFWADDMKYLSRRGNEEFGFTIKAYYSPEEFDECDGVASLAPGVKIRQQTRKRFAFSWETIIGNDTDGDDYARVIHIAYGATASPATKEDATINDSSDISDLSWECKTTPVNVNLTIDGKKFKPTAIIDIEITSSNASDAAVTWLEEALYGVDEVAADSTATPPIAAVAAVYPHVPSIEAIYNKFHVSG